MVINREKMSKSSNKTQKNADDSAAFTKQKWNGPSRKDRNKQSKKSKARQRKHSQYNPVNNSANNDTIWVKPAPNGHIKPANSTNKPDSVQNDSD